MGVLNSYIFYNDSLRFTVCGERAVNRVTMIQGGGDPMQYEDITVRAKDSYPLRARCFDCPHPKAVVLVLHGMEEHKGRYDSFASYLQENSYTVLTCDMRGHGADAPVLSHIASRNGDRLLVEDVRSLTAWLKKRYPDLPLVLFAHSMGTIIARKVLQADSRQYARVVLSGYPVPQKAAAAGILLCRLSALAGREGWKGHSAMVTNMAMGGFSKAVHNAKTPLDWLSYNEENVRRYQKDPLCGVEFTLGSYDALFRLVRDIANPKFYHDVQAELPILLISGEDDPCTGGESGRKTSIDVLRKAGFSQIKTETIAHMRHEILNEDASGDVFRRILRFLKEE